MRTVADGGESFYFCGDHRQTIPTLYRQVVAAHGGSAVKPEQLDAILAQFPRLRICVVGDLFLDKYLDIDRALAETSLETGLEAHQVTRVRCYPGAGGTVATNLAALGIGQVAILTLLGDDGEGYDLRRAMQRAGHR